MKTDPLTLDLSYLPSWIGFLAFIFLAWLFSEGRFRIRWVPIALAAALQFTLAWVFLETSYGQQFFQNIGAGFRTVKEAYDSATVFLLGKTIGSDQSAFALTALPMVIFVSALSAILFHFRILQVVVALFAFIFRKILRMSGPEAVAVSGNIFFGMAEAPTLIAPYISKLSRAQLFSVMTAGMATVSGSLLVFYSSLVAPLFGEGNTGFELAAAHLLAASVVSAPAAFLMARLLVPENQEEEKLQGPISVEVTTKGFFDALFQGSVTGLKLTAYIVALLLSMVAMIRLINIGLATQDPTWSVEAGLAVVFSPLARLMGIAQADLDLAGQLLGIKVGANEFLAYLQMNQMTFASERSAVILSWALCGFANFGSIAIMIGSLAGLCPEKRPLIASLGLKAMIAGFLSTCLTGTVVGMYC